MIEIEMTVSLMLACLCLDDTDGDDKEENADPGDVGHYQHPSRIVDDAFCHVGRRGGDIDDIGDAVATCRCRSGDDDPNDDCVRGSRRRLRVFHL